MSKDAFIIGALLLVVVVVLPACAEDVPEESAVQLPPREHTWVRKEAVKKTKGSFIAKKDTAPTVIPVNEELAKKLTATQASKIKGSVKDTESCLSLLKPLDNERTAVQKAGGMWGAFERSQELRGYSDNGMQIDSWINKLIFALGHLCKTAKGLPQDNISRVISQKVSEKGKNAVAQEFMDLGKAKKDIQIWLKYAEYWQENQKRDLDFNSIEGLMARSAPLIDLYEELTRRKVDANSRQGFLSDAVTLLETVKKLSSTDEYLVLALKEEKDAPYENLDPDM